ncbi:MAG: hypothetical protein JW915_17600 [Chitinispirillaceae bacterium]|nr:hypothetical protein [Chitinispirillaceae bacterium]
MVFWIKKLAFIIGLITFFASMAIHFSGSDPFNLNLLLPAIIKSLLGASILWFAGFIIGDIFFKGVLTDVPLERNNLIEGGMLQRIHLKKEKSLPGGEDMPLVTAVKNEKNSEKKKK